MVLNDVEQSHQLLDPVGRFELVVESCGYYGLEPYRRLSKIRRGRRMVEDRHDPVPGDSMRVGEVEGGSAGLVLAE